MPSDFTSAVPGSAVWQHGQQTCRGTGRGVLIDAATGVIWDDIGDLGEQAFVDATGQAGDDARANGWSTAFLTALATRLTQYGHSSYAQAVRSNMSRPGSEFSTLTLQGVLWAATSRGVRETTTGGVRRMKNTLAGTSPSAFTIQPGTVMPTVGSVPPEPLDVSGATTCGPTVGASSPRTPIVAQGVSTINPLLVAGLIAAAAIAAIAIMEGARTKQGARW